MLSGPGRVQGTGNGDPHCHEPNNAPWHSAWHGLVRAVIAVTSTSARDPAERQLLSAIDVHGPMSAEAPLGEDRQGDIIVQASSPGFEPVTSTIPTSTDAVADGVYAAAAAYAGKEVTFVAPQTPAQ